MKQASREAATSPSVAPSHAQLSSSVLRVLSCGPDWGGAESGHEENPTVCARSESGRVF